VTARPVGYFELLRLRPAYRQLWLGSVVSLAGDWFTLIALYTLLQQYTGKSESVGLMLAARFFPLAIFAPAAGVIADRLSRRHIMIACDVLRAVVVLGFLLVRSERDVWLVYALTFAQMGLSAFFDPAEQAAIASSVQPDELVTANTLAGATWSAMLGVGAIAGGLVAALVGRQAAFAIDALSYLLSAFFISRATLSRVVQPPPNGTWTQLLGIDDFREGLALVVDTPRLRRLIFVKSSWSVAGGAALVLYAVMGERVFPVGGSPEFGIGILLAMRGLGAFFGPIVARHVGGDSPAFLEKAISIAFLVNAVFWFAFSQSPWLWLAALMLAFAHTGTSTQWVFSSSLISMSVDDRLRGRAFSLDQMLQITVLGVSSWLGGFLLDHLAVSPRTMMAWLSVILLTCGGLWYAARPRIAASPA
jgi:MFS family permease